MSMKNNSDQQRLLASVLEKLGACEKAVIWATEGRYTLAPESIQAAWNDCPDGFWMEWLFRQARDNAADWTANYAATMDYCVAIAYASPGTIRKRFPFPTRYILQLINS